MEDNNDNDNDDTHPPRILVRVGMVQKEEEEEEQDQNRFDTFRVMVQYDGSKVDLDWRIDFRYSNFIWCIKNWDLC